MPTIMTFLLGKRQANIVGYDNDDDDDDGLWGYSAVSFISYLNKDRMAYTSADWSSHKMGGRWRYPNNTRTLACPGTHARSKKDQTRSTSDGVP